ncbi:MAG: aminotransferase class V-fold PLP-dependent enzyme [Synechococcaceae cyanobacterium ELA739]
MPALANKTYFNYGGQGPLPNDSLASINAAWATIQELGPFSGDVWPYVARTTDSLRQRLAGWFGVSPARVAFSENVTTGCLLPLWGLPWQAGDQLLISDAEHPGVVAGIRELARREGLELAVLPVMQLRGTAEAAAVGVLAALEAALTPRTRLVALSHILWNTGQLMPIAAVAERLQAHDRQPWLLVDAAQSLGAVGVAEAAAAADIYACTGHKWCCGPEGLGAVALSERLLADSAPTLIGWRSLSNETAAGSAFHRDARRFEVATSCLPLFAGLDTSLQLLEAEGEAQTRLQRIRERSQQLWQGLQAIPQLQTLLAQPPPAGLVSFVLADPAHQAHAPGMPAAAAAAWVRRLGEQRIWLRSLDDPICLRACTHLTTTAAEVEQLLAALAELAHLQP